MKDKYIYEQGDEIKKKRKKKVVETLQVRATTTGKITSEVKMIYGLGPEI